MIAWLVGRFPGAAALTTYAKGLTVDRAAVPRWRPLQDPTTPAIGVGAEPSGAGMAERIFGEREIADWEEARRTRRPQPPTDRELLAMPAADAMIAAVWRNGIGFRVRLRSGREIDFALNPVLARAMMMGILEEGRAAGWLDAKGNVTAPLLPIDG